MNENVNIPLLRKAVEWAEAEAAKPVHKSSWNQDWWAASPEELGRDPECGTCFCIAGYVASMQGEDVTSLEEPWVVANAALGLPFGHGLFSGLNTIEDVRRIAEELAGERL